MSGTKSNNSSLVTAQVVGRSVPERRDGCRGSNAGSLATSDGGAGRTALPEQLPGLAQANPWAVPSLITAGVLLLCAGVLFCFDPSHHGFYPQCLFHHSTGLLCPGCGALRALHQLLHGHLAVAFRYNALLISALPFLGWLALRHYLPRTKPPVISTGRPGWWLWAALVVVVVFGIVRNLPLASLACLRP